MTVGKLSDAEKIVQMTEWNDVETWDYSEDEESSDDYNLAAAKRFLAAQTFLFCWQEGKVPTSWRRPRRIADFDGKLPRSVIEQAEDMIAENIAERNFKKTARLNAALSARATSSSVPGDVDEDAKMSMQQLEELKTDMSHFNHEFFEVKSALSKATTAVAEISFRIQAISEVLK